MNWGKIIAWGGIFWGLGAAIGYICVGDYRRALYFFLGAAITAVVIW